MILNKMTSFGFFKKQLKREILLSVRQPRQLLYASLFFLMVVVFFPLTMPPKLTVLRLAAPGLIWIAMLLSILLSSVNLFSQDYEEGVLEQWLISGYGLRLIVHAKLLVHCGINLLPMLIFCPLMGLLFHFNLNETLTLMLSLIAGVPAIVFLSGLCFAFSTGKGILMALILLPLTIPVMIFGSGALAAVLQGFSAKGEIAMLAAISLIAFSFLPFVIAAVIRISLAD